jgi:hypothetical protein
MSTSPKKPDVPTNELDSAFVESMRQAFDPDTLDIDLNERLIGAALSAADVTEGVGLDEIEQADLLAKALDGSGHHPLAELAQILAAAYAPRALTTDASNALVRASLREVQLARVIAMRLRPYAAAAIAIAAGALLFLLPRAAPRTNVVGPTTSQLMQSRSVAPLFAETFSQTSESQRLDRIYAVRSRELRHNRYVAWRVQ